MNKDLAKENKISLWTTTIIGLNAMIGAGIISTPLILSTVTGPAGILTFMVSILLVILIGLSLGAVAEFYPGEGWNYLYPASWGGHIVGMISSFCYLAGVTIAMGFLVQQAGLYANHFFSYINPEILGTIILIMLTLLIIAGTEVSSIGQYVIIIGVVVPLIVTSVVCWFYFDFKLLTNFMPNGTMSVFKAAPSVLFGFLGFESIASLYAIVKNPKKNVPRACILSVFLVGMFYLFFSAGILFSIPSNLISSGRNETLASVLLTFFPSLKFLSILVSVGALFAIIGTLHSMIWSLSVLLSSILERTRSRFFKSLSKNLDYKKIVLLISSIILFLSLFLQGSFLLNLTVVGIVPSFFLSIIALLFIRKEWETKRNVITIFALVGALLMFYFALIPVLEELGFKVLIV